jgi:hypothetical protein
MKGRARQEDHRRDLLFSAKPSKLKIQTNRQRPEKSRSAATK